MTRDRPFDALSEAEIQRAVFIHFERRKVPNVFAWHTPMGGFRRPKEAAIFKGLGARAGIPDVLAIKDGRIYGLELKTLSGHPTPVQLKTLQHMQRCGATVAVTRGLDAAIQRLEEWGLVTGSRG